MMNPFEVHVKYRRQEMETSGAGGEGGNDAPVLRRRRRGVNVLPTLFTLGNCICGFASLHYASRGMSSINIPATAEAAATLPARLIGNFAIAGYFIFAAMLFDMFDGFVARLTKSASDFGAELDSLADMVSFGVAPSFLALNVISALLAGSYSPNGTRVFLAPIADSELGKLFWVIGAIYVACTALRLARFNVITKHDIDSHMGFRGMPSPGAAGVVAATIIFFETLNADADRHLIWFNVAQPVKENLKIVFPYLIPLILLTSALLMVSRFRYTHLINRFLRGRKRFRDVVFLFLLIMLLVWQPQITTLVAIYIYAVSAPFTSIWRRVTGKKPAVAPAKPAS